MSTNKQDKKAYKAPGAVSQAKDHTISSDIPILKYGPRTNLSKFKDALINQVTLEFGRVAQFLENGTYFVPVAPVKLAQAAITAMPAGDRADYEVEFRERRKNWTHHCSDVVSQQERVFGIIWMHLSQESQDKVRQDPDWADINLIKDPLRLWKRIQLTHSVGGDAGVPAITAISALSCLLLLPPRQH
jgi:hypothetical protein